MEITTAARRIVQHINQYPTGPAGARRVAYGPDGAVLAEHMDQDTRAWPADVHPTISLSSRWRWTQAAVQVRLDAATAATDAGRPELADWIAQAWEQADRDEKPRLPAEREIVLRDQAAAELLGSER